MKYLFYLCLSQTLWLNFSDPLLAENLSFPSIVQRSQKPEDLPPVPSDDQPPPSHLPENKTRPGGGLNQEPTACNAKQEELTVLIPQTNNPHPPLTLADPLTILIYFPDQASDIQQVEFWINSEDEKTRILGKQSIALPSQSGIVSITLPNNLKDSLEVGQNYHWFLQVSCQNQTYLAVNGWVQRVTDSQNNRWYDSLANLAQKRSENSDDPAIEAQWKRLLESIDASDLADQPIFLIKLP